jgi:hypothetical protein
MHCPSLVAAALAVSSLSLAASARAQPRDGTGYYVQATIGFALPQYSESVMLGGEPPTQLDSSYHSLFALTSSLLVGAPLRPGLVLGGGVLGNVSAVSPNRTPSAPTLMMNGYPYPFDEEQDGRFVAAFVLAGPFVDYYPMPIWGFHVQAMGGLAVDDQYESISAGIGYGLMGGVGYDTRFSDRWSAGVLARLTFTSTTKRPEYPEHDLMIAPSLEASFTYH